MKKFVEKIKAWFKGINWKKVGCAVLTSVGVGLVVSVLKEVCGRWLYKAILSNPDYGMKLYCEACDEFDADGNIDAFNKKWSEDHPEFDASNEDHIQAQTDAFYEMFKPYLDKVAKKNAICGYMLDFDEHEPVVFKAFDDGSYYKPEIHATIKKID